MTIKQIVVFSWLFLFAFIPLKSLAQDAADAQVIYHTVIEGENLYNIAEKYNTSIGTLIAINHLTNDAILQVGQLLTVSGIVPLPSGITVINDQPELVTLTGYPPISKIHRVVAGDSLGTIAEQYNVSLDLLILENELSIDTILQLGDTLFIPGETGSLLRITYVIEPGDTLDSIGSRYNNSADKLLSTNAVINPHFLPIGLEVPIISRTGWEKPDELNGVPHIVGINETITTIAASYNLSPILLAQANGCTWPCAIAAGMQLLIPGDGIYRGLPSGLHSLTLNNTQPNTGETVRIKFSTQDDGGMSLPSGRLRYIGYGSQTADYLADTIDQFIPFAPVDDHYVGLVGLDAFAPAGLYQLELIKDDQTIFSQPLQITRVDYGFQSIPLADNSRIRAIEDAYFADLYAAYSVTTTLTLTSSIVPPVDVPYVSATYGAARSYAGMPVTIFHSGVDYAAPVNTPIKAVAGGTVVFSDFTELRGNVVIIDHGWGVMSAYFHMENRLVIVGEVVGHNQAIGSLGNTGLSTGAHLHWEMLVHGVSVNGSQWLREQLP